jgi:hypothetical protein
LLHLAAYILRSTVRHVFGRTPKGQTLLEGFTIQILRLVMGASVLNINQSRKLFNITTAVMHFHNGTLLQSSKDQST